MNENMFKKVLNDVKTIAVIGALRNENKPANYVPKYLKDNGYKIIPINPFADEILGEKCYKNLLDIPENIDLVLVFRPSNEIPDIVKIVIERKIKKNDVKYLWLQEGIYSSPETFKELENLGVKVFQNICIMKVHKKIK